MQYIVQSHNKEDACNIPPGWVNKDEVEGQRNKRL